MGAVKLRRVDLIKACDSWSSTFAKVLDGGRQRDLLRPQRLLAVHESARPNGAAEVRADGFWTYALCLAAFSIHSSVTMLARIGSIS